MCHHLQIILYPKNDFIIISNNKANHQKSVFLMTNWMNYQNINLIQKSLFLAIISDFHLNLFQSGNSPFTQILIVNSKISECFFINSKPSCEMPGKHTNLALNLFHILAPSRGKPILSFKKLWLGWYGSQSNELGYFLWRPFNPFIL